MSVVNGVKLRLAFGFDHDRKPFARVNAEFLADIFAQIDGCAGEIVVGCREPIGTFGFLVLSVDRG